MRQGAGLSAVAGAGGGVVEKEDEDDAAEHDGFFEADGGAVEAVEVGVVGLGGGDIVDGAADGDAVPLHVGDDPELGEGGEAHHDDGDGEGHFDAAAIDVAGAPDDEEDKDNAAGDESFVMEDAEAPGDDGTGGVGVGESREGSRGGHGKKEESAEPEDESQPDDGAYEDLHGRDRV